MRLAWGPWVYGLFAALIGGGASAATTGLIAPTIAPGQFGLGGNPGWNNLKLSLAVFIVNGVISAFAFLKQSPLPQIITEVTKTESVKIEKKAGE